MTFPRRHVILTSVAAVLIFPGSAHATDTPGLLDQVNGTLAPVEKTLQAITGPSADPQKPALLEQVTGTVNKVLTDTGKVVEGVTRALVAQSPAPVPADPQPAAQDADPSPQPSGRPTSQPTTSDPVTQPQTPTPTKPKTDRPGTLPAPSPSSSPRASATSASTARAPTSSAERAATTGRQIRSDEQATTSSPTSTEKAAGEQVRSDGQSTSGAGLVTPLQPRPVRTGDGLVERVVEVVPPVMRHTLLAAAIMGLLLGFLALLTGRKAHALRRQRASLQADIGFLSRALMPDVPDRTPGLELSVAYQAAAGLCAGGDFYDVSELAGGRTAIVLGDVSGHGKDAVMHAAAVRHAVHAYLKAGLSPRDALKTAGETTDGALGDHFATVIAAVFDPADNVLTYSCAGHPRPLSGRGGQGAGPHCPPLGLGIPTGFRQSTVRLTPGRPVVLFTDGLTEARRPDGSLLDDDGLQRVIDSLPAGADADALLCAVTRAADSSDDMAACVLRATAEAEPATSWTEQIVLDGSTRGLDRLLADHRVCPVRAERVRQQAAELVGLLGRGRVLAEVRDDVAGPQVSVFPVTLRGLAAHEPATAPVAV